MRKHIFIILSLIASISLLGQVTDDYRIRPTITSGSYNWNSSIWQRFDGTSWNDTSNQPGNTATANNITIGQGIVVQLTSNLSQSINSITIGDESGGIDTLSIDSSVSISASSLTTSYDGFLTWSGNYQLTFTTSGASVSVESPNPDGSLVLGEDYGIDESPGPCNSLKAIIIDGTTYSSCNGGGGPTVEDFETVNLGGGNLSVSATADNTIICKNSIVQLTATPGGLDSGEPSPSYNWTVVLPNGDTEAVSTDQNPTTTITEVGTHTFEVTFTNSSGITAYNTVQVIGRECKNVVTNRRITYRVTPVNNLEPVPTLPLLASTAYNIQRYRDNGSSDERLDFSIANTFNFSTLQVLVSDVEYSSLTVQSFNITNPNEDLYSSSSPTNPEVISGPSSTGTGYDHLFILTGTSFSGNRTINITIDTPSPNGSIDCGGSCPKVSFYGL